MAEVEYDDALVWLKGQAGANAKAVIFDPPYAVGTPVRGREDGAAGSVFAPFGFMHTTLGLVREALAPGGVCVVFADWRRMHDLAYMCSTVGLRPSTCVAWVRNRPGTGGLFRASWDPILMVSRGVPDAVDRAAIRNVIETDDCVVRADYPTPRLHPYGKPAAVFEFILPRMCKAGDLVLDPFAGSGVTKRVCDALGFEWRGCDIDPAFAKSA